MLLKPRWCGIGFIIGGRWDVMVVAIVGGEVVVVA
jgi:hypothetical protein